MHPNGYAIDVLEQKMIVLEDNSEQIMEEYFMMNLFDTFVQELHPLKEHLDYMHAKKKQKRFVSEPLNETSLLHQCLRK